MMCRISRISIIAIHQSIHIYTISLLDLKIEHRSELFVTKYHIRANECYVVDISLNCGLHPIVFKSGAMNCYLTLYQSEMLKKKENKSAMLDISFTDSEVHFLSRKVKEVVNFIMSHFSGKAEEDDRSETNFKTEEVKTYPFCYKLQLKSPKIMLLRSSLSNERLVSEAENITIHNINDENPL